MSSVYNEKERWAFPQATGRLPQRVRRSIAEPEDRSSATQRSILFQFRINKVCDMTSDLWREGRSAPMCGDVGMKGR